MYKDKPSFSPIPKRNPINAPNPDFKEVSKSLFSIKSSAAMAPIIGPIIIPIGGKKNNPTKIPTILPRIPALLPPIFLVLHMGIKLSIITTKTVIVAKMVRVVVLNSTFSLVKWSSNKATQAKGGPGMGGKKLKMMAPNKRINPTDIQSISITLSSFYCINFKTKIDNTFIVILKLKVRNFRDTTI